MGVLERAMSVQHEAALFWIGIFFLFKIIGGFRSGLRDVRTKRDLALRAYTASLNKSVANDGGRWEVVVADVAGDGRTAVERRTD